MLRFKGCEAFRPRLVLSALSGKPIRISDIRNDSENPGLREHEASLLRLISKVSVGSKIEINPTGTTIVFKPGSLIGGTDLSHECPPSRGIGYYIEALLCLAPFGKSPLAIVLSGTTNANDDPSVDAIRTVILPMLKFYGVDEDSVSLKVNKRGALPLGGGEVYLRCGVVKELKPIQFEKMGKIKRIRGIAYATKVAPQMANRMIDAARSMLSEYTHDLYMHTDHYKGHEAGLSPGFGLTLVAESTSGALYCGEWMASESETEPESVGSIASKLLLEEIIRGGCVDTISQSIALLFCALGPEDVSRLRLATLSPYAEAFLEHLRDFFGVTFKRTEDRETNTIIASCVGSGFLNIARKVQ